MLVALLQFSMEDKSKLLLNDTDSGSFQDSFSATPGTEPSQSEVKFGTSINEGVEQSHVEFVQQVAEKRADSLRKKRLSRTVNEIEMS